MDENKYIMIGVEYLQGIYDKSIESAKTEFESQHFDNLFLPSSIEINEKYLIYIIGRKIEVDFPDNDYDDPNYDVLFDNLKKRAINKFRKLIGPHVFRYNDDKRLYIIEFIHNI